MLAAKDPKQQSKLAADEGGKRLAGGDLEGALERYAQALALDSANTDARYQRATVLGHLGRVHEIYAVALADL